MSTLNNNNDNTKRTTTVDDGGSLPSKTKKDTVEADRHFICPITLHYPIHPVVAGNGKIWEKSALEKYIQLKCPGGETTVKCPTTGEDMPTTITPSPTIKNMIGDFINNDSIQGELAEIWTKVNDQINEAKNGNGRAMHDICCHYGNGSDGFPHDNKESFLWAKKAHGAGFIPATLEIGTKMLLGDGTAKNTAGGLMHLSMAAQGGDDLAAFILGKLLAKGWYGLSVDSDKAEAIKWLKVTLSAECKFQRLPDKCKQDAQNLLDELLSYEDE